jgi:pyrroline-5-carboxylate reductase
MVTSPGGTTIAGLRVLEEKGFKQSVIDAITAAAKRAKELSKEWT